MQSKIVMISLFFIFLAGCGNWVTEYNSERDVSVSLDVTNNAINPLEVQMREIAAANDFEYVKKIYAAAPEDFYSLMRRPDIYIHASAIEPGKFEMSFHENKTLVRSEVRAETLRLAEQFASELSKIDGISGPKIEHAQPDVKMNFKLDVAPQ